MFGKERVEYKSPDQIRAMRRAGLVVADALDAVADAARPGVTTAALDAVAVDVIMGAGAVPSFTGYGYPPFPGALCTSVNDQVVHAIPGPRVLLAGDVLSVDCGAVLEGWHGDAAISVIVGPDDADPLDTALVAATRQALWAGVAALAVGARLHAVGAAVQDAVASRYGIVEDYVGHGIGTAMHQAPQVPNYRVRERGMRVRAGLCVAVEPMLVRGSTETATLDDEWTVVTTDGSRAAHWEHTVAVTERGPWVLTSRDGGREDLAALGVAAATDA